MSSIAQDLRNAAIYDTGLDALARQVLTAFFEDAYDGFIQLNFDGDEDLRSQFFLLLVAEALDFREPMSQREKEAINNWCWRDEIISATEAHHHIGIHHDHTN